MKALTLSKYVAFIDDYSRDGAKPSHQPAWRWTKTQQYAAFLSLPFDVGMLCNLKHPKAYMAEDRPNRNVLEQYEAAWQAAEDKVIFKGWSKDVEYRYTSKAAELWSVACDTKSAFLSSVIGHWVNHPEVWRQHEKERLDRLKYMFYALNRCDMYESTVSEANEILAKVPTNN